MCDVPTPPVLRTPVFFLLLLLASLPLRAAGSAEARTEVPPSEGARILVFVDDVFSVEARRDAVLRRLGKQLDVLGPRDAASVVAWDGDSVETLAGWTGDRAELEAALDLARERDAYGLLRRSEWARLDSLDDDGRRSFGGSSFSSIGFHGSRRDLRSADRPTGVVARHLDRLAEAASTALETTARETTARETTARETTAPTTGRRAMLLLSGGLPPAVGPDAFDPVTETAGRLGWAVYPVDLGAALVTHAPDPDPSGVLASLAERTGGVAYLDGRRFTALRRALVHLRSGAADAP